MASGSEEFDALIRLLRATSAEAVPAAENAAAKVYLAAAKAAVPRKTGQLEGSVKIIEGKPNRAALTGELRQRLFVGPEKRKGYYGYFVEKGHQSPKGKAQTFTTRGGKRTFTTRRIARTGRGAAHSQQGLSGSTQIQPHPWFYPSQRSADSQAETAASIAFDEKLQELNNRI